MTVSHAGPGRPLVRFVLRVLGGLAPAFALWYFAAPILLWPVRIVVELVARGGFGDLVETVEASGATLTFVTTLRPGLSTAVSGQITVDVDMLLYSYGMPLLAALVWAAREERWALRLAAGYALLVPFAVWGALADFLKAVAITSSPLVASQTGFVPWQREAIAFAYQFGTLILPAVVPAVVWILMHRAFLERLRGADGNGTLR
jgi:hypothetical protein